MGGAGPRRALSFDWPRYHAALVDVIRGAGRPRGADRTASDDADRGRPSGRVPRLNDSHVVPATVAGRLDASWTNYHSLTGRPR